MQAQEIMTGNPICCTPNTDLQTVANLMARNNCGAIPVVDSQQSMHLRGIVTDRDIVCRAVAKGTNLKDMAVNDCMSSPVVTVFPQSSLEECCQIMEAQHVRRVPVVDSNGCCCGIVAQADIARNAPEHETAEVVREISFAD